MRLAISGQITECREHLFIKMVNELNYPTRQMSIAVDIIDSTVKPCNTVVQWPAFGSYKVGAAVSP